MSAKQPQTAIVWLRTIPPERGVVLALLALALLLWWGALASFPRPVEVTVFAVGDGNAVLVRTPGGHTVLIDGGSRNTPDVGQQVLMPNLLLRGIHRLDAIIVSHPDSDHLNGLATVMDTLPVNLLVESAVPDNTNAYLQMEAVADHHHIPRRVAVAGDRLSLGDHVTLDILAPGPVLLANSASDTNNNSIVCLLTYQHASLLFTGDLEEAGEEALLARGSNIQAQVILVAHHGSRHGSSTAFLAAVHPTLAIISTQGGPHTGLPHPDALARLRTAGISVWRTDVYGQIALTTTGTQWRLQTFLTGDSTEP